jgi:dTDP-4-dehydrorhamnose 3,5-epimerase
VKLIPQTIPDVVLIQPTIHDDDRGYFVETFRQDFLNKALGYKVSFIQDNESKSTKGVLRGLHYQLPPYSQAKLVRVLEGEVLDVAVDIREGSDTFGQYVKVSLTAENKHQLFIPRGFAHGFVVLSEVAVFSYKVDNEYAPEYERAILWDDKILNIEWDLGKIRPLLSKKDRQAGIFQSEEYFKL